MSAKTAGGVGSIVFGVIAIIAAIPTGGGSIAAWTTSAVLQAAAGAAMIGVGIYSLAFSPSAPNRAGARSAELQYSTAADGVPLPVIFGEQRVVGNFMNYTVDNFRSRRVVGRSDGSKGADSGPANIIGYDYFLTYEYGLCMGPVDEIVQVFAAPGERKMMGATPTAVVYSSSDEYKEVSLDSIDPTSGGGAEGGIVRLYRGSAAQSRITQNDPYHFATILISGRIKRGYRYKIEAQSSVNFMSFGAASNAVGTTFLANNTSSDVLTISDSVTEYSGLNYRNICWALFIDYKIGRFPQPKSYHFVLRRYPAHSVGFEMLRPDGSTITGFLVRGSSDNTKPAYTQANPAAIIYECLTNKIWGRGLPQEMFDEASWIAVSAYFASRHIGMSFTIDTQEKIGSVIDGIRAQLKTITTWDGEFLKLRCLLDLATTHGKIQTLTKADFLSVQTIRPMWHSTINEIRAEFQNKTKNYRPDAVHVSDLGNRQMTGRTNSERIALNGFNDFNTVRRQSFRILREKSYPVAGFECVANRFKSQLEVGDVFQLWWDEYDADSTVYCLVAKIEDSDSGSDDIKITAIEDQTLVPATGHEAVPSIPSVAAWELIPDVSESEVGLWTGEAVTPVTGNFPFVVIEIPPILANRHFGSSWRGVIAVIAQQPAVRHSYLFVFLGGSSGGTYSLLSHTPTSFAIAGTISMDYTVMDYTDRSDVGFTFTLFDYLKDEAALLSMFSSVDTIGHDLETLISLDGPFLVIQNEIFQVGKVDKLGTNSYRARNIVRGRFGTPIQKRANGTRIMFMESLRSKMIPLYDDAGNNLNGNGVNTDVFFKAVAKVPGTTTLYDVPLNNSNPVTIYHDTFRPNSTTAEPESEDTWFIQLSDRPLSGEYISSDQVTNPNTVTFRPRRRTAGAESIGRFFSPNEMGFVNSGIGTLDFVVYVHDRPNSAFKQLTPATITKTFDGTTGLITVGGIPATFSTQTINNPTIYDTNEIIIATLETAGTFSNLQSGPDLIVKNVI